MPQTERERLLAENQQLLDQLDAMVAALQPKN